MDRRKLAERYLDGQMSRRVFLRRLVGTGVTVGAAIAYSDILLADPAHTAPFFDYYVGVYDYYYLPDNLRTTSFQSVQWGFGANDLSSHSVTDPTHVLNSGFRAPGSTYGKLLRFSGTFRYKCKETTHPLMEGKVHVPMAIGRVRGPLGTAFPLGWSHSSPIPAPYVVDVQRRRPSDLGFKRWITGTHKAGFSYVPNAKGKYRFRARTRNTANQKKSAWSPVSQIVVT